MNGGNLLMLGVGLLALLLGAALLFRRGGSDASVYVRRIAGTMLGALGVVLIIFAVGLAGVRSAQHA